MINNLDAEGVKAKVDAETGADPLVRAIYEKVAEHPAQYGINPAGHGLEITSTTIISNFPNRCRIKVFSPESGKLIAWFYKPSAVHFSRDRYSLGSVLIDRDKFDLNTLGNTVNEWLVWLDSGLDPAVRPSNWKSAVPYDIPQ